MDRTLACRDRSSDRTHIDSRTPSCRQLHCLAPRLECPTTAALQARTNSICHASHSPCFGPRHSAIEPDRHAGLELRRIALRIEAQAKRIAIVIADRTLGLPRCEGSERSKLGD